MSTPEDLAATRAEPLPEERIAGALDGNAPADGADEHRTSSETAIEP